MDITTGLVPRTVDVGRGIAWWREGWALFTKNAGMWIVLGLISLVVVIVLGLVPVLGGLAVAVLTPVFLGGWMLAARKLEGGGALEVTDLFSGFKDKLQPLAVIGAVTLAGFILIGLVMGALGAGAMMGLFFSGMNQSAGGAVAAMGMGMLGLLVVLLLGFVISMALWFAPALVVFKNAQPVDAIKASFAASLKNILPFLLFGVLYLLASVIASVPFGLGWVVLVPVSLLTMYTSYKDLFEG